MSPLFKARSARAALLLSLVIIQGCATTSLSTMSVEGLSRKVPEQQNADIDSEYKRVLSICESTMAGLSGDVTASSQLQIALAAVGIIAGSIIVPALAAQATAAKSVVAAWGGVAGATNAAQLAFNQKGASTVARAETYKALRKEIADYTGRYTAATTDDGRLAAINTLAVACTFAPLPEYSTGPSTLLRER